MFGLVSCGGGVANVGTNISHNLALALPIAATVTLLKNAFTAHEFISQIHKRSIVTFASRDVRVAWRIKLFAGTETSRDYCSNTQFKDESIMGDFGQNDDYRDRHPDELPVSQHPPTDESQCPDSSRPYGVTETPQHALGSQSCIVEGLAGGPSRPLLDLDGSPASLGALEPLIRKKSTSRKQRIAKSLPDPNWRMPPDALGLHEAPQRTTSYPPVHNVEQTPTNRGSSICGHR
jgi:hypothetical protein